MDGKEQSMVTVFLLRKGYYFVRMQTDSWWSKVVEHNGRRIKIEINGKDDPGFAPDQFNLPVLIRIYDFDSGAELTNMNFDSMKDFLGVNIVKIAQQTIDELMMEI